MKMTSQFCANARRQVVVPFRTGLGSVQPRKPKHLGKCIRVHLTSENAHHQDVWPSQLDYWSLHCLAVSKSSRWRPVLFHIQPRKLWAKKSVVRYLQKTSATTLRQARSCKENKTLPPWMTVDALCDGNRSVHYECIWRSYKTFIGLH